MDTIGCCAFCKTVQLEMVFDKWNGRRWLKLNAMRIACCVLCAKCAKCALSSYWFGISLMINKWALLQLWWQRGPASSAHIFVEFQQIFHNQFGISAGKLVTTAWNSWTTIFTIRAIASLLCDAIENQFVQLLLAKLTGFTLPAESRCIIFTTATKCFTVSAAFLFYIWESKWTNTSIVNVASIWDIHSPRCVCVCVCLCYMNLLCCVKQHRCVPWRMDDDFHLWKRTIPRFAFCIFQFNDMFVSVLYKVGSCTLK